MNTHGYPPMAEQKCQNCRYVRAVNRQDDVMSCRRNPPVPAAHRVETGDPTTWGMWPAVLPHLWCGHWAPQEPIR